MDPSSLGTILHLRAIQSQLWRETHDSYIAGQRVVTERLCRAHLPRWKLPRYALDHSIRNSGWQRRYERETCGVLCGREPGVVRDLRDHSQKYNAPSVRHTGRKALNTVLAEHAYDLQIKFENETATATMFCRFPTTSSRKAHPTGHATGTQRGKESTM